MINLLRLLIVCCSVPNFGMIFLEGDFVSDSLLIALLILGYFIWRSTRHHKFCEPWSLILFLQIVESYFISSWLRITFVCAPSPRACPWQLKIWRLGRCSVINDIYANACDIRSAAPSLAAPMRHLATCTIAGRTRRPGRCGLERLFLRQLLPPLVTAAPHNTAARLSEHPPPLIPSSRDLHSLVNLHQLLHSFLDEMHTNVEGPIEITAAGSHEDAKRLRATVIEFSRNRVVGGTEWRHHQRQCHCIDCESCLAFTVEWVCSSSFGSLCPKYQVA